MSQRAKIHNSAPRGPATSLYAPRTFNRRSRQRFTAARSAELLRQLGREASYAERILIERLIATEFELRKMDAHIDAGEELPAHTLRARLAAENRLRLDLRELGLMPNGSDINKRQRRSRVTGYFGTRTSKPADGQKLDPVEAYRQLLEA